MGASMLTRSVLAATTAGVLALAGSPPASAKVKCPIKASAASTPVEWAFTESAPPGGPHKGIISSYTHGRGRWQAGRASGTVCHTDLLSGGKGSENLVLAMAGAAKLSPRVTRGGLPGVELALKVNVAASDDPACPAGGTGTVTLFASYFSVHRDTVRLRFAAACATHDHLFTGPSLHVLITRKGAQVNSA
jgi:hypothetical protein